MKDPFSVEGKVTIITGGGSGIGAAMAREFARRGAPVLIAGRTLEKLERTRDAIRTDGGRIELKICDIADAAACDALIAEAVRVFGRLDVMINNAGGGVPRANAAEYTPEQWQAVVATNLYGAAYCSKAAVLQFVKQRSGGVIINVSSTAGMYGQTGVSPYAAAKAGLINYTMSTAMEWAPLGIRVNCLTPGPILNERNSDPSAQTYRDMISKTRPLGRFGLAEEMAWPAIFLASDASGYITGSISRLKAVPATVSILLDPMTLYATRG